MGLGFEARGGPLGYGRACLFDEWDDGHQLLDTLLAKNRRAELEWPYERLLPDQPRERSGTKHQVRRDLTVQRRDSVLDFRFEHLSVHFDTSAVLERGFEREAATPRRRHGAHDCTIEGSHHHEVDIGETL
jgi:hypothetical protein